MNFQLANITRCLLITLPVMGICCFATAQTVEDVSFYQDDQFVLVSYDLLGAATQSYTVELYLSLDSGKTFSGPLQYVSGDVGNQVKTGRNLLIRWDAIQEKEQLISYDVVFWVMAKRSFDYEPEMVPITGGAFLMGFDWGGRIHTTSSLCQCTVL